MAAMSGGKYEAKVGDRLICPTHMFFCLAFLMHDRLLFDVCMQLLSVARTSEDSVNVSDLLLDERGILFVDITFWKNPSFLPLSTSSLLLFLPRFDVFE